MTPFIILWTAYLLDLALNYIYTLYIVVGIPMVSNHAPLLSDLFLFCYERYFMLSDNN